MQLQMDTRIRLTLLALQQLARYLAGIPGRKNVIWFSGSFPISVLPDTGLPDPFKFVRSYQGDVQATANLLSVGQVALYPIAAEGLTTNAMYSAGRMHPPSAQEENESRAANQASMEELAKETGGRAFYNPNGLGDAMVEAINNGTRYYTLSYTPSNEKMDGKFRNIQVKLAGKKYKLSYRRGYYAEDTKTKQTGGEDLVDDPLLPLMQFGMPDSTQIFYKIRVLPSNPQPQPDAPRAGSNPNLKGPITRYGVDFAIPVQALTLETAPDGVRHGNIEVRLVAYDSDGKPLNLAILRREIILDPKMYAAFVRVGLQIHEDIDVPGTNAYLCTGAYDLRSREAGTLGIALNDVTSSIPPVK